MKTANISLFAGHLTARPNVDRSEVATFSDSHPHAVTMAASEAVLQTSSNMSLKASAFSIASLMSDNRHHHHHHHHHDHCRRRHRRRRCSRSQRDDDKVFTDVTMSSSVTSPLAHDAGYLVQLNCSHMYLVIPCSPKQLS